MMLVLSRKEGEKIFIGEDIKITVLEISKSQVRIGIEAPKTIEVDREEIREHKNRERLDQAHE